MITNTGKKHAEEIAGKVAPLLATLSQFAKTWEKKDREHLKASQLWRAWQFYGGYEATNTTPEESKKAEEMRHTNPKAWAQMVDKYTEEKERARVSLFVARVNFQNFLNYTAETIAEMVRPYWREYTLRRGFEDLGALLSPVYDDKEKDTPHAFRLSFKISGGNVGAQLFPSSFIRLTVAVYIGGIACGLSGKVEGVKMGEDVPDTPRETTAPHVLTVAEYVRAVEKLEQWKNQAEQVASKCAQQSRELVQSLGLYGFAEFMNSYKIYFSR